MFKMKVSGRLLEGELSGLKKKANEIRACALTAIHAANSGHPGTSLSSADLLTALYFRELKHNPKNPYWKDRDRFVLSKGHAAPALYSVMANSGYFKKDELMSLRKLGSRLQGHPDRLVLKGIEFSTGCLGQGLGLAVGSAIAAKQKNKKYRIYCMMGDGEQQSGNIWESAMAASHYKLDNLTAIVDKNNLQICGSPKEIMNIDPLAEKYRAFGWNAVEINGHDFNQIVNAYEKAKKTKGKPTVIIANTTKGKGVSFMENKKEWHSSKKLGLEQLFQALNELGSDITGAELQGLLKKSDYYSRKADERLKKIMPEFSENYWWNSQDNMKAKEDSIRQSFGRTIQKCKNKNLAVLVADSDTSINTSDFRGIKVESGIAEQNLATMAAGMAKEGYIAVMGGYSIFFSGRNWDQLRTSICYNNLNVKMAGVASLIGQDGATHQATEDLYLTMAIPNMKVFSPSDAVETEKITKEMLRIKGPCYIRLARSNSPVISNKNTPMVIGKANIIKYMGIKKCFEDSFETKISNQYSGKDDISIIATGITVPEAMRAAYILKEENGIESRVINMHTLKPIDKKAVIDAAENTKAVITVEDHQKGALGNIVSRIIMEDSGKKPRFYSMGLDDRFGESGKPYELIKEYGLSAEHIAKKAKSMIRRG